MDMPTHAPGVVPEIREVLAQLSEVADLLRLFSLAASDVASRSEGGALLRVSFDALNILEGARLQLNMIRLYDPRLSNAAG